MLLHELNLYLHYSAGHFSLFFNFLTKNFIVLVFVNVPDGSQTQTQSAVEREPKNFEFECTIDDECLANTSCIQNQCLDPCTSFSCKANAKCSVTEHRPECSCLEGYIGDPNKGCRPLPGNYDVNALCFRKWIKC